ncbi:MAG TPA: hypothetical protein VLL75_17945 [Vicinamibacteria bacterium]|nr:hypothetical protein [Vicinamibacteria bacterium]
MAPVAESSVVQVRSEARSVEELRERVSDRFRSVGATAGALRAEVRAVTDPRRLARRHPVWVLGAAAGAGLLAAGLVRRGRRRRSDGSLQATLAWMARFAEGHRPPRLLATVGAPVVRAALGILASMLVRQVGRRLRGELRPRRRLVTPRRGQA